MTVDLDHPALVSLVKGTSPHYDVFNHPLVKQGGSYIGGFHDRWDWDTYALKRMTAQQLWELYQICKAN